MTYSCSDFTDTIIEALGVTIPEESYESPSDQADLCLEEIGRLHRAVALLRVAAKPMGMSHHDFQRWQPKAAAVLLEIKTPGSPSTEPLGREDLATVLAALRYYQSKGLGDPDNRPEAIHDVATDGGAITSLDDAGIDDLCERLNTGEG